jgi:hypothetical protein
MRYEDGDVGMEALCLETSNSQTDPLVNIFVVLGNSWEEEIVQHLKTRESLHASMIVIVGTSAKFTTETGISNLE